MSYSTNTKNSTSNTSDISVSYSTLEEIGVEEEEDKVQDNIFNNAYYLYVKHKQTENSKNERCKIWFLADFFYEMLKLYFFDKESAILEPESDIIEICLPHIQLWGYIQNVAFNIYREKGWGFLEFFGFLSNVHNQTKNRILYKSKFVSLFSRIFQI